MVDFWSLAGLLIVIVGVHFAIRFYSIWTGRFIFGWKNFIIFTLRNEIMHAHKPNNLMKFNVNNIRENLEWTSNDWNVVMIRFCSQIVQWIVQSKRAAIRLKKNNNNYHNKTKTIIRPSKIVFQSPYDYIHRISQTTFTNTYNPLNAFFYYYLFEFDTMITNDSTFKSSTTTK